jgi:hypothetical protein
MKELFTTVAIRARPEAVWATLIDGPGYARWNPEINRVDGRFSLGEKIKAYVVLHGGVVRQVSVRVTDLTERRKGVRLVFHLTTEASGH